MKYHIIIISILLCLLSCSGKNINTDLSPNYQNRYIDNLTLTKKELELTGNIKSVIYFELEKKENDNEYSFPIDEAGSSLSTNSVIRKLQKEYDQGIISNFFEFDKRGNLIREITNSSKSKTTITRLHKFDFSGLLIETEQRQNDKLIEKDKFTYDKNRRLIKIEEFLGSDLNFISKVTYRKDSTIFKDYRINDNLDTIEIYRSARNLDGIILSYYDSLNFEHDSHGNLNHLKIMDSLGTIEKSKHEFFSTRRELKEKLSITKNKIDFKDFNNNSNIKSITIDKSKCESNIEVQKFNEFGNVIQLSKIKTNVEDGIVEDVKLFSYEYDSSKNWIIKKTSDLNGEVKFEEKRKIEYYK